MMASARERLNEIRQQRGTSSGDLGDILTNAAQQFNKGIVNTALLPVDIGSAIASAFSDKAVDVGDLSRESLAAQGIIPPEDRPQEGVVSRGAEILGSTVAPAGLLQGFGRQVLKQGIPLARQSVLQALGSQAAAAPRAAAIADVTGSGLAAVGGELAKAQTDDPGIVASSELAAGLAAPIAAATSRITPGLALARRAGGGIQRAFNTPARVAKRVQDLAADPEQAAARIDPNSPVSPARQTEDPRLIALEERLIQEAPAPRAREFRREAETAEQQALQTGREFGGDVEAPGRVIGEKGRALVRSIQNRAQAAAERADEAIAKVDPQASPRDISRAERNRLESSLSEARREENAIWSEVDLEAPAGLSNTRQTLDNLRQAESRLTLSRNLPDDISALQKLDEGGELTLKDLQSVRSELGDQIRRFRSDGEFNKARIAKQFSDAILEDMGAVDQAGVAEAREFSRELNRKFTQGKVGEILRFSRTGERQIDEAETLGRLFSNESSASDIRQFIEASPESRDGIQDFVRSRFLLQATNADGSINKSSAERAIKSLESQGVFEEFPELQSELQTVAATSQRAANLKKRAEIVRKRGGARLERDSNESLASTFLNKSVGQETDNLLTARNPVQLAGRLRRAVAGNENAEKGLKTAFAESLQRKAESGSTRDIDAQGRGPIVGNVYNKLILDNQKTLEALGFSADEITRLKRSAAILRQLQAQPEAGAVKKPLEDAPAFFLEIPARVMGARLGGRLAKETSGGSIQTANIFAERARGILNFLTQDRAKQFMVDMLDKPELWKAFLLRNSASLKQKEQALTTVRSWLAGLGIDTASDIADT